MIPQKARRVPEYIGHMIEAGQRIRTYVANLHRADFLDNTLVQDAVIRNLEVIGEAARNIELADPEFTARYPEVPWTAAQGMRHRLAHGYHQVNLDVVWVAVERDIPELIAKLQAVLAKESR